MDQMPTPIDNSQSALSLDQQALTPDYFVAHYAEFLPRYISGGRPAEDTMTVYVKLIDSFVRWCLENKRHPLSMHDYEMRIYLQYLYEHGYTDSSVNLTMSALRIFFKAALKLDLIKEHPCKDIRTRTSFMDDSAYLSFSPKQINEIHKAMLEQANSELEAARNTAMLYMMAIEGLRNVEVMRMCDEDIDFANCVIMVRGKGHVGTIYPSEESMDALRRYFNIRPEPNKNGGLLTPTFIAIGNRNKYGRITRNGIRLAMDKALKAAGYRKKGYVCHILRHSCGTNLYAATKDLRVVQETLRQRDPKVTARYAHVQERMTKRYTGSIIYHEKD